jgi:hypothetical protein
MTPSVDHEIQGLRFGDVGVGGFTRLRAGRVRAGRNHGTDTLARVRARSGGIDTFSARIARTLGRADSRRSGPSGHFSNDRQSPFDDGDVGSVGRHASLCGDHCLWECCTSRHAWAGVRGILRFRDHLRADARRRALAPAGSRPSDWPDTPRTATWQLGGSCPSAVLRANASSSCIIEKRQPPRGTQLLTKPIAVSRSGRPEAIRLRGCRSTGAVRAVLPLARSARPGRLGSVTRR